VLAIFAGVISGACNTLLLAVINMALKGGEIPIARPGLLFVGLCLLLPLTRFASEGLLAFLGHGSLLRFRMQISRMIISTPLARLEELGAHRLLAMLTDDVPVITSAVMTIPMVAINVAVVVCGLIYLGMLSWKILLAVLAFMIVSMPIYQFLVIKAIRFFRRGREEADTLVKHFRAITEGTKELKLHRQRREEFFSQVLWPTSRAYRKENLRGAILFSAAGSCGQGLVFAVVGLTLFVLPSYQDIGIHTLTAYTLTYLYLAAPIQSLMNMIPALGRADVAMKKVDNLGMTLAAQATEDYLPTGAGQNPVWNSLELDEVIHTYRGESELESFHLGPVSLVINQGEMIFLVGGNGSGKTTLAKLITGLYVPEAGEVRLNDRLITDKDRDDYRQNFSAVFFDYFLFESLLGLEPAELDERARNLLSELQLDRKVQVKNGALSTTNLSSGQRKRLALLTAYLEDRPVYIFDEWAADQDPLFREVFYGEILPGLKARGKTVIAITHDEDYYDVADRIIKMNSGKVEYDRYNPLLEPVSMIRGIKND
jgi:putative ATP-binding cassette transporter